MKSGVPQEPKMPGKSPLGSQKSDKEKINKHERSLAERLPGAQAQPSSGATPAKKGDVLLEHFLLDSKETKGQVISLSSLDFTKICREAGERGREPGLVVTLGRAPATVPREWVVISLEVFARMVEAGQDGEL